MRVFVYEFLTAHGVGRDPGDPLHGMYREGRAMRDAVLADLRAVPGVEVETRIHTGEDDPDHEVWCFAERCDWSIVIAPETGGELDRFCWAVRYSTGRLLGPSPEAITLTTDKVALAHHWREHGVPTPPTTDREPTACEVFPVVWKPRDGAGSVSTFLLNGPMDVARAKAVRRAGRCDRPMILQTYTPGRAASVAFLCGPRGKVPLLPCFQHLSDDGRFTYHGGELPIPPELAGRAVRLATPAVECVPGLNGFVGVDLVLGGAADGSQDYAIEINPRPTTSYVGLRALADFNLAAALLRVAAGDDPGPLRWKPGPVRFAADGMVG
jgi:predicted ATP-grasp superfamily ATP-dependent carboligase